MLEQIQNIENIIDFISENWLILAIGIVLTIAFISLIVRLVIEKFMVLFFTGLLKILLFPFQLMLRFPFISLMFFLLVYIYFYLGG